jgi:hypothetical protein
MKHIRNQEFSAQLVKFTMWMALILTLILAGLQIFGLNY